MKNKLLPVLLLFGLIVSLNAQQKNILFIAVDDLKPNLHCYGDTIAISPNIDRLAEAGTIFANNQCQQAVCGPSRASLLTGWRPDRTKVWDLHTLIRDRNPNVVTLPQFFKEHGYNTYGTGKIFDPRSVDSNHDTPSWDTYVKVTGSRWIVSDEHVSTECVDTTENIYVDGKIANEGLQLLEQAASESEPFFVAVGFKKPHLPFVAPATYWNYYDRDTIPLAPFQQHAANTPDFVYNPGAELRNNYVDIPTEGDIPIDKQKELVHGYYACVSFIDAQVGKLLNKLDTLGLSDNTIIVLWGDHGWHLGDHAQWTKHTNFEQAARAPMIIVDPSYQGGRVITTPTEFLDIYPTLCDLAGLEIPDDLAGVSLKPILNQETNRVKDFAISQYARGGYEGYTLRTDRYRYTEWLTLQYREGTLPYSENIVHFRELYDYELDPLETVNVVDEVDYQSVRDSLHEYLANFLIHQFDGISDTTTEIIQNPDFEEGLSPWEARQCQIRIENSVVQHGSHSLFVYSRTKKYSGASQLITNGIAAYGKGKYYVSAYYKFANQTDTAKIQIRIKTDSATRYFQVFKPIADNEWHEVSDTLNIDWNGNLTEARITFQTKSDINVNYYIDNITLVKDTLTSVIRFGDNYPAEFMLYQNYPNPFNPTTTINYVIASIQRRDAINRVSTIGRNDAINVSLKIYDALGREVTTLVNERQMPGQYSVKFTAERLPSGIYFYSLLADNFFQTRKMILLK